VDSGLAVISLVLSGLALLVAIASAVYTRQQVRVAQETLPFERARHEEELRRLRQEQERAQASRVFASAYGRSGQEYQVHIENRSDAPIRELYAVVEPQHPGDSVSQGDESSACCGPESPRSQERLCAVRWRTTRCG
jgi:hypothetical protein